MSLTADELDRYARHIVLPDFGGAGQARLRRATVAVVGAGGVGSPAIQYLAGAGVGRLRLADPDRVEPSNLQRQVIYAAADRDRPKVEAAADAVARLNPHVAVEAWDVAVGPDNAAALLDGADAVLDGSDNFGTRLAVADAALRARVPLVSAAVTGFEGQLATYRGWEADKPCYRCFVGAAPAAGGGTCADDGVLGPAAGVLGTMAALEAVRAASPFGEDSAGRLLLADLLAMRFRSIRLPKDPGCPACGVGAC